MDYMTAETRTQTFARGTRVVKFNVYAKAIQKEYCTRLQSQQT